MISPTVHIIDDDAHLIRPLTRLLRTHGYGVQSYTHLRNSSVISLLHIVRC
jgi:FixJ family two-component response regulator